MRRKKYIILFFMLLGIMSCENLLYKKDMLSTDAKDNFKYLWDQCDKKYSYFTVKKVNWDDVYTKYDGLIYNGMPEDSLFKYLGNMIVELKDDHANIQTNIGSSFYGIQYKYQDNFDFRIINDNYLAERYSVTGPFSHGFIKNQNIGYIRFASFVNITDESFLNNILNKYKETKGLILDLRENPGGVVTAIHSILSRFINNEVLVGYTRYRNGNNRDSFSESKEIKIKPYEGIRYTKKIIVLVDRGSYSAASFFSLFTKAIPHITLMGDTTGGGLGLPNGGQLPNGWYYRFSVSQTLDLNKNTIFELGVPPDIAINMDWTNRINDEILDAAILEINK